MKYEIREIQEKDDAIIERIIRNCLIEYGGDHEGTAWADPNLGHFSKIYNSAGNKYWVAEDAFGNVAGGVGIGKLEGSEDICELQKMYLTAEARGTKIAYQLMDTALDYAVGFYKKCYLETLESMTRAQKFYEKYGFIRIYEPPVKTEHFMCDVRYIKELNC